MALQYTTLEFADAIADILCYHRGMSDAASLANREHRGPPPEAMQKLRVLKEKLLRDEKYKDLPDMSF